MKYRSRHVEPVWVDVSAGRLVRVDPGEVLDVPDACPFDFPETVWEPIASPKKAAAAAKED